MKNIEWLEDVSQPMLIRERRIDRGRRSNDGWRPVNAYGLTSPDLNSAPFGGEFFETELIMPGPCPFIDRSLRIFRHSSNGDSGGCDGNRQVLDRHGAFHWSVESVLRALAWLGDGRRCGYTRNMRGVGVLRRKRRRRLTMRESRGSQARASARTLAPWMLTIVCGLSLAQIASGQARTIDTPDSKLTVHVSKAGLFSALGDNHDVEAPISEGVIDENAQRVAFVIESRRMKVLDPNLAADKRKEVQERMLGAEVLDVARFPQIKFESTGVEQAGSGHVIVHGQLTLHGATRSMAVSVRTENGHYLGSATLKQQEFGITPIAIAGGTVKVKDEVKIEFDIRTSNRTASMMSK